jgi:alkanesulfonate monooxygenase
MSQRQPRFGIWAPYRGEWIIDPATETYDASFDHSKRVVLSAERAGFDTVLFAQHTISPRDADDEMLEAWTASAAAAAITDRIEIIAAIKPRLYHPVVLAKMALGIEDISNGRFALNLVNAWFKPELEKSGIGFPEHDDRYEYGTEWLRIVRGLMAGERITHHGKSFHVTDYNLRPVSRHRARPFIYAGGESEPARRLVVELADCWLINGRPLEDVEPLIADVSRRARVGEPIDFGTTGFVATRPSDHEAAEFLEDLYRRQGNQLEIKDRESKIDPKAQTIHFSKKYMGMKPIGANGGILPGFVGSYDTVARRFADFYRAGVTTFLLSFFPLIEEQELFAQEIIPRVRALTDTAKPIVVKPRHHLELADSIAL